MMGRASSGKAPVKYKYVAVAISGSGVAKGYYSGDGLSWTASGSMPTKPSAIIISNVKYLNGKFFAAGLAIQGGGPYMSSTTDGVTWSALSSFTFPNSTSLLYGLAYGAGKYLVGTVAQGGSSGSIWSSTNGTSWTNNSLSFGANLQIMDLAYGNGTFVVVGFLNTSGDYVIAISSNGTSWTSKTISGLPGTSIELHSCTYANGTWVVSGVSSGGVVYIIQSTDNGSTWSAVTTNIASLYTAGASGYNPLRVEFGGGKFALVFNGNHLFSSPDLATWAVATVPTLTTPTINTLIYGYGKWLYGGDNGSTSVPYLVSGSLTGLTQTNFPTPGQSQAAVSIAGIAAAR